MTKNAPGLWWVGPGSLSALLRRAEYRATVEHYWRQDIRWRWAQPQDWPPRFDLLSAFSDARKDGFGFVADIGPKRLFLVPSGWPQTRGQPDWALAESDPETSHWLELGAFEPASPTWELPAPPELAQPRRRPTA